MRFQVARIRTIPPDSVAMRTFNVAPIIIPFGLAIRTQLQIDIPIRRRRRRCRNVNNG